MNKILYFLLYLLLFLAVPSKPLYKKSALFSKYKINITIKTDGKYENNINLMRSILNQKLYYKTSRASNLKLIVSISRSISIEVLIKTYILLEKCLPTM